MLIAELNTKTVAGIAAERGGVKISFTDGTILFAEEPSINGSRPDDYVDEAE